MHHASKMLLKLFTLFHPRQLSSERTYARSHPAEGAGARRFAAAPAPQPPGPRQSHGLAPHGRRMMGRCFPPYACAAGRAVPICGEGTRCGAARRELSPSPLRLRSPAATEQHISLCRDLLEIFLLPQVQQRGRGDGDSPSTQKGRQGRLAGRMRWMHGEEHGCLQPCTWWIRPGRSVDERVCWVAGPCEVHQSLGQTCLPNVGLWRTTCPLCASNHISMGHSSSPGLLPAPQASREEKPQPHVRSL